MTNKYFRVVKSNFLQSLKDGDATVKAIKNNKFVYIDFDDQKHVKLLQDSKPNQSDQQAQIIGSSCIGNINNLSDKTYQMLKFLSQTKHLKQKRNSIDNIVRNRINSQRKKMLSHNNNNNSVSFDQRELFKNKNITSAKLQEFLEDRKNARILKKLQEGQQELERSVSEISSLKKNKILVNDRPPQRGYKLPPILRLRNALQFK